MLDRLLAVLGFSVFCGFLAILVWKVPRADLIVLVAITIAMAGYDLFFYHGRDDHG